MPIRDASPSIDNLLNLRRQRIEGGKNRLQRSLETLSGTLGAATDRRRREESRRLSDEAEEGRLATASQNLLRRQHEVSQATTANRRASAAAQKQHANRLAEQAAKADHAANEYWHSLGVQDGVDGTWEEKQAALEAAWDRQQRSSAQDESPDEIITRLIGGAWTEAGMLRLATEGEWDGTQAALTEFSKIKSLLGFDPTEDQLDRIKGVLRDAFGVDVSIFSTPSNVAQGPQIIGEFEEDASQKVGDATGETVATPLGGTDITNYDVQTVSPPRLQELIEFATTSMDDGQTDENSSRREIINAIIGGHVDESARGEVQTQEEWLADGLIRLANRISEGGFKPMYPPRDTGEDVAERARSSLEMWTGQLSNPPSVTGIQFGRIQGQMADFGVELSDPPEREERGEKIYRGPRAGQYRQREDPPPVSEDSSPVSLVDTAALSSLTSAQDPSNTLVQAKIASLTSELKRLRDEYELGVLSGDLYGFSQTRAEEKIRGLEREIGNLQSSG